MEQAGVASSCTHCAESWAWTPPMHAHIQGCAFCHPRLAQAPPVTDTKWDGHCFAKINFNTIKQMNVCFLEIKKHIFVLDDIRLSQILEWHMKIKRCFWFSLPSCGQILCMCRPRVWYIFYDEVVQRGLEQEIEILRLGGPLPHPLMHLWL